MILQLHVLKFQMGLKQEKISPVKCHSYGLFHLALKKTWSCLMFGAQVVSQSTTSHPSSFCASKIQAGYCFAAPFVAWFVQQNEVLECA